MQKKGYFTSSNMTNILRNNYSRVCSLILRYQRNIHKVVWMCQIICEPHQRGTERRSYTLHDHRAVCDVVSFYGNVLFDQLGKFRLQERAESHFLTGCIDSRYGLLQEGSVLATHTHGHALHVIFVRSEHLIGLPEHAEAVWLHVLERRQKIRREDEPTCGWYNWSYIVRSISMAGIGDLLLMRPCHKFSDSCSDSVLIFLMSPCFK